MEFNRIQLEIPFCFSGYEAIYHQQPPLKTYCTMRFTVVECDKEPEAAVTVKGKDCGV